ncbi:hypothetical protein J2Z69_001396 [Paenibacillus shirakamiensis]|uniref:Papain-like cysteine peptidase n=1 Tax=Paenibacillus shirakamiensis TaxID=1265935 RepID=A0ABS4JFA4_9BACL|nr:DUF1796 family putative cysteine peptidase [Paenibacillus shirakamiensis]MBP2000377.1 hypothetical protein [Paenibacillus shirakamiensis]
MLDARHLGSYDVIVSLGPTCQPAYQLRRLQLRTSAGPLDWFISKSHEGFIKVISQRFDGFMTLAYMKNVGEFKTCYCIEDTLHQIYSYHDFSMNTPRDRWQEDYLPFHDTLIRRQTRFLERLVTASRSLFVRMNVSLQQSLELCALLDSMVKGEFTLLIIVTDTKEMPAQAQQLPSQLAYAYMGKGDDWRGPDEEWNQLLAAISIG